VICQIIALFGRKKYFQGIRLRYIGISIAAN